ncbi:MAG: PIG-L deacetylase family protein [Hyphomicrobiaceae bacterium]
MPLSPRMLDRSAIVFAPHYDDETLGCGGMIIKKAQRAADCHVVFMTDGTASHGPDTDRAALAVTRRHEAEEACRILGVPSSQISSLDLPDQGLAECFEDAVAQVQRVIADVKPEQIWLPHSAEPFIWSTDHRATTAIVRAAALRSGRRLEIMEYLVWLWLAYPWVSISAARRAEFRPYIKTSISSILGIRLARSCALRLDVSDVLERKWAALAAYRSQTGALPGSPSLGQVANGQFLDLLFQTAEIYSQGPIGTT